MYLTEKEALHLMIDGKQVVNTRGEIAEWDGYEFCNYEKHGRWREYEGMYYLVLMEKDDVRFATSTYKKFISAIEVKKQYPDAIEILPVEGSEAW